LLLVVSRSLVDAVWTRGTAFWRFVRYSMTRMELPTTANETDTTATSAATGRKVGAISAAGGQKVRVLLRSPTRSLSCEIRASARSQCSVRLRASVARMCPDVTQDRGQLLPTHGS
jgi:hypothetical protein